MVKQVRSKHTTECIIFGVYSAALMIQNILALKTIDLAVFVVTTGILISPVVFILQDIECELFGYRRARMMILCAYMMNFVFIILSYMAILIPGTTNTENQEAFKQIFSTTPRIVLASFIAYCTGSLMNAKIMTRNRERNSLFYRAIMSTAIGQICDNFLFVFIAFYGHMRMSEMIMMVFSATIFETGYELVVYPITKKMIYKLK